MDVDSTHPFIGHKWWHKAMVTFIATVPLLLTGFAVSLFWGQYVHWQDMAVLAFFWMASGLGISVGFHRMVSHSSLDLRAPAKAIILWFGMLTLQGGVASWAATHRRHHARADMEGDPHSPLEGFVHAHLGWLFKGRLVHSGPVHEQLMQDKMVAFFERTQLLWYVSSFLVPGAVAFALGGQFWTGVLWGGAVRIFLVHHITWSINSICHMWGTRPYRSPDVARNNAIFGVLGFGEGWHNNHHAFPKSAYLGHRWYQIDPGRYLINFFQITGMVKKKLVPTREERAKRSSKVAKAAS